MAGATVGTPAVPLLRQLQWSIGMADQWIAVFGAKRLITITNKHIYIFFVSLFVSEK